jgi:tetratricopeptide (TPR) repeat protein
VLAIAVTVVVSRWLTSRGTPVVSLAGDSPDRQPAGELADRAPADGDAALQAFAARGLVPPKTVSTRETPGEVDREWVRRAIAPAEVVERTRFAPAGQSARMRERTIDAPTLALDELAVSGEGVSAASGVAFDGGGSEAEDSEEEMASPVSFATTEAMALEEEAEEREFAGPELMLRARSARKERAGETEEVPRRLDSSLATPPRFGKILFQGADGKHESLVPRALRVQVLCEGPRARTVVDCVFSNSHSRRLQGTFYYSLPAGGSPVAFGMFRGTARMEETAIGTGPLLPPIATAAITGPLEGTGLEVLAPSRPPSAQTDAGCLVKDWGELQVSHVVGQKRARQVYEEVVRRDIDPALLEWSGGNTFQARVFPIEPHSLKRVVLVYEETLPIVGGDLRYSYPVPDAEEVGPLEFHLAIPSAHAELRAVGGLEPTPANEDRGWKTYSLAFQPGRTAAVELSLKPRNPEVEVLKSSTCRGLDGPVFFARLRPPIPSRERESSTGRALFLVDTSLSASATGAGFAARLLEEVLASDATIEEYAVLLFDIRPRWLHAPGWRTNDGPQRADTMTELGRIYLEGATSFDAVLAELDGQAGWLFHPGRPVSAFLLSDGFITWGQDRLEILLGKYRTSSLPTWLTYQFGNTPVNAALFAALSRLSGGRTVTVLTTDELVPAARAHRTLPVLLAGVTIQGAPAADLVVSGEPRYLFAGQDLQVAGRLPGATAAPEIVVEVSAEGGTRTWRYPLHQAGESLLAPRAWAELHVARLLALDDERLERMIVALSQRFDLANRAASLLILENDKDYEAFDLTHELVDLADLEALRTRELDRRHEKLQGIDLDGAPAHVLEIVSALEKERSGPPANSQPFLDRSLAGGEERIAAEAAYREARAQNDLDVRVYDAVARARALAGDTAGALRAYSCLVEQVPNSAEAARLAGYACLALGRYEEAAEIFERVRLQRPFEPQAFLEEALALEGAGVGGRAARNLEIVLLRDFPRHQSECKLVAAYRCGRILAARLRRGGLEARLRDLLERRVAELAEIAGGESFSRIDLQLSIHWNTDGTDVDLWVVEPGGERCYYEHRDTAGGGKLFWDTTDGYGPELYVRRQAASGVHEVFLHYFGNRSARWSVPTAVLQVRDRAVFASEDEFAREHRFCLLAEEEAVMAAGAEEF